MSRLIDLMGIALGGVLTLTAAPFAPSHAASGEVLEPLMPGDHQLSLFHGGRTRTAIVHLPPQAKDGPPLPLVLNFHGRGGSAAGQRSYTGMDRTADREGFIVVYPNGTRSLKSPFRTWNAGSCCGYAAGHDVDDVGFTLALIDRLAGLTPVDRTRVYATGFSNGAMLAYRIAAEAPGRIAAIAPVAGGMMLDRIPPGRPIPILHIHSVDDPRAIYGGGPGPPSLLTRRRVTHPNIERMLALWTSHDGCPAEPKMDAEIRGRAGTPEANQTARKYAWSPCGEHGTPVEVVLWKLSGAGHAWPGGRASYHKRLLGPATSILDANSEIWAFFSRYRLDERAMAPSPE